MACLLVGHPEYYAEASSPCTMLPCWGVTGLWGYCPHQWDLCLYDKDSEDLSFSCHYRTLWQNLKELYCSRWWEGLEKYQLRAKASLQASGGKKLSLGLWSLSCLQKDWGHTYILSAWCRNSQPERQTQKLVGDLCRILSKGRQKTLQAQIRAPCLLHI